MSIAASSKPKPTNSTQPKIAVIGGGVAGMAAAIRMAAKGFQVHLYEAGQELGGKLSDQQLGGFRFDNGPSLFTLPELLEELFQSAGRQLSDYLAYEQLELVCRYYYPDGSKIDAWADPQRFADEIEKVTAVPAKRVMQYLRRAGFMYETTTPVFLEKSLHKLANYLNWPTIRGIARLPMLGVFQRMHDFNLTWLKEKRVVQLFDRFATYNGSDPYQAPATLIQISHIEHQKGAWYPRGGMIAIRNALHRLLEDLDVSIHLNSPVSALAVKARRIVGLHQADKVHTYDKVIFAGDIHQVYERLLPGNTSPKKLEKKELSTSALIFHWGVKGSYPTLDLHNIFFSEDYRQEFDALAAGKLPDEATIYVYVSSKHNPIDAPAGHENWFVMINTPADSGQDWQQLAVKQRALIISRLSKVLKPDIAENIVTESFTTPLHLAGRTGSAGGAIYGRASNNKFSAFLRHPNYSSRIKGLYFCGGSVHPGGGIPLCLHSARIVEDLIG